MAKFSLILPKGCKVMKIPFTSCRFPAELPAVALLAGLFSFAPPGAAAEVDPDEMELVREIHARIVAAAKERADEADEEIEVYSATIPDTNISYEMAPVPGGEFTIGSPEDEPGREEDEGPRKRVKISPFWMGSHPVTWNEFELFMYPGSSDSADDDRIDAVSRPTPPYVDMSFGMGKNGYPAISMTHHAASKYCQWLSAKTGRFYRLPTEAEWEYAARAGTDTAYFFGDDPQDLDEYAWHDGNSENKTQPVGQKKPNPLGLYDIHGNVWEWTLDQYLPDGHQHLDDGAVDPWAKPDAEYPRVVRGGSWNDGPERLRSAARRASSPDWKMMDPQLPQSVWYHTNALWLGFRLVRPREIPSPEEMYEYWNR